MTPLSTLKGLGPKSVAMLAAIGIHSKEELDAIGPVAAFLRIRDDTECKPSLNLLYALVGAVKDIDWRAVAREDRHALIMTLDGYDTLEALFDEPER